MDTYGTGKFTDDAIEKAVLQVFDCRPAMIIEELGLDLPIYTDTTNFGHFGKEYLSWEETDKAYDLVMALKSR